MFRPEPLDLVLILFVALLLFGANRLPETARAMGKSIREFRDAITGKDANDTPQSSEAPKPKSDEALQTKADEAPKPKTD